MNLNHPARPITPPRPVDPAGAVDHAQIAWPTAPWTALTTRRPQAPQPLLHTLAQHALLKEARTATTEGGNINVQIGVKLGVLLTARESTVAGLAEILAQHGGGSGVAFAWEMQLLAGKAGVGG